MSDNYHKNQCHTIQHELLQITEQPSILQKTFICLLVVKADKTMLLRMLIPDNMKESLSQKTHNCCLHQRQKCSSYTKTIPYFISLCTSVNNLNSTENALIFKIDYVCIQKLQNELFRDNLYTWITRNSKQLTQHRY